MTRNEFAVITGTGVAGHFELLGGQSVKTEYGTALAYRSQAGYFVLPRHGPGHKVPPHMINYRANIAALERLGVRKVIGMSAVGTMTARLGVGQLGLVDQFLDFTKRRKDTFFEANVRHTDMSSPYSEGLNSALVDSARALSMKLREHLVYVCAEGPRFETAAEIKMFRRLGGDVVGMTGVPEVVLAREKGLEYASVVVATNWAAGMQAKVSHDEVLKEMKKSGGKAKKLIEVTIKRLGRRS